MRLDLLPAPEGASDYLAVDKPAGVPSHGPGGLLSAAREEWGDDVHLVHRLDRETSGVLLLARGLEALRAAHEAWPDHVEKTYVALTRGVPSPREGVVDAPLLERRTSRPDLLLRALKAAYGPSRAGHLLAGRRVLAIPPLPEPGRTAVHPAGRPALTAYRVLSSDGATALVELSPRQGRMHQVRVHLAHLGTPLRGDRLYDPAARPGDETVLRAVRLVWRDPPGAPPGTAWVFEAPPPER